jgi:hypothetical protein
MYKSNFSIDGDRNEEGVFEGYTDGTLWNGSANVCFTREQVAKLLDSSPYDYRFLESKTVLNKRDYPVLLVYFGDHEEVVESTPLPTKDGEILEGYFMEDYCFIEVRKETIEQ